MSGDPRKIFVVIASLAGLAFAFLTPPFQTPDEIGHFWRATSIAYGRVLPASANVVTHVPDGMKLFVFVMEPRNGKFEREQFRISLEVMLNDEIPREARFPAAYTPVPYVPQIIAALIGRAFNGRPVITFYLGRIFNLAVFVALVAFAIHVAPFGKWIFCVAGLLPMSLFLAGSWSPDAVTIGLAFLFTAACSAGVSPALPPEGRRDGGATRDALLGFLVGLAKPAYFLIAFLALLNRRLVAAIVITATLIGAFLSIANAARAQTPRSDVFVDSAAQQRCLVERPLHFAEVALRHAVQNGAEYAEQMTGRLGMLEIKLPVVIIWSELLLLIVAALASGGSLSPGGRVLAILIFVATVGGIFVASYIGYSRSCDVIEGIQGRYLLPVLPVLLLALSMGFSRERLVGALTTVIAVVANVAGIFAVVSHYYY